MQQKGCPAHCALFGTALRPPKTVCRCIHYVTTVTVCLCLVNSNTFGSVSLRCVSRFGDRARTCITTISAADLLNTCRYDVTATLVEYPPASLSLDEIVLAGCELEQDPNSTSANTVAKQPPTHNNGTELLPLYTRFQEAHHRLSQMDDRAAMKNTGLGEDLPPGMALANIADHPAFCVGFSRADADVHLKDLEMGTFLLRAYSARVGNGAQGSIGGGGQRNGASRAAGGDAAGQTPMGINVVVVSVVCAGGPPESSGTRIRHLVFRAAEATGGIDFDNEEDDDEADGGISCGLVGPERTIGNLLLRIRKMGCEGATGLVTGERASGGLHTPNASLLEALSR